uniref:Immunoglobulin I-set domain protein n=1 Tax=Echinostoma caproni TaxID=27848 RepID=A0A182ZZG7_9TREM
LEVTDAVETKAEAFPVAERGAEFAPQFVQPLPERLEVHEGEAALLECRVEAKPKADVHWLYDDRPLDVTSQESAMVYESTITDEGQISLLILESLHEDEGLYRCEAVNELGTAHTQTQLVVIDVLQIVELVALPELEFTPSILVFELIGADIDQFCSNDRENITPAPPVAIVKDLADQRFAFLPRTIRFELTLSVEVETVIWLKDGTELTMADGRCKLTHVGPTYQLSIESVTEADMGQYEVVYDVKRDSRTSACLTLEQAPDAPTDVSAEFVIPASPTDRPQDVHVSWTEPKSPDGKSTVVDSYLVEMKPQEGRSWYPAPCDHTITKTEVTLSTTEMKDDVAYEFRVYAVNQFGKSPPSKPSSPVLAGVPIEFIRPLQDVTVTGTDTEPAAILECELSRAPRTPVAWTKDRKPLVLRGPDASRILVEEAEYGRIQRLIFKDVLETDLASYAIQAESISCSSVLDMKVPPTLRVGKDFVTRLVMKAGTSNIIEVPFAASPKPKVTWTYGAMGDAVPSERPRFKTDTVSGLTSIALAKVKPEDAGLYQVTITNELGETSITVELIVLDKPSVPRNPKVTDNTGESVVFTWTEPQYPGGGASPLEYVVEMREPPQQSTKPVTVTTALSTPIENLKTDKTYVFSVAARNGIGQSDFVHTQPITTKLQYGPPQSPVNVKAVVNPQKAPIEQQSIDLTWEQPTDTVSGAGPVTNFYIEMKPTDSTRWQDVSAGMTITEPHCTLPSNGMKEFTSYEFRVISENKAGKSKPSGPSNPVELGMPLEFVRPLEDVALTEAPTQPVVIECELSRKPREKVQWLKDGKPLGRLPDRVRVEEDANGTVHRVVFTSLQDEDLGQYTIRVEKLSGDARVDLRVSPTLRLSEKFTDKIVLKAGASSVIEVPFMANPKPTVKWTWKPRVTPTSEPGSAQQPRFKPDVVSGLTSLPLGKVKREDAGDYEVVISNELGEATVTVQLIVLDKPSVPRQLEVSENTGERVLFSWREPEFTGLPADVEPGTGLTYVVEMREATQRVGKPVTTTPDLKTPIEGLQLNKSYIFSVAAKNDVGQSDFVDTQPVSTKLEYGKYTYIHFYSRNLSIILPT